MKRNSSNKKYKAGARVKLIIALILLTLFCVAFIAAAQYLFLDYVYLDIQKKEISEAADILRTCDTENIAERCEELGAEKTICIEAYVIYGNRIVSRVGSYELKPNCNCLLHRLFSVKKASGKPTGIPGGFNDASYEQILKSSKEALEKGNFCYIDSSRVEEQPVADENITAVGVRRLNDDLVLAVYLNTSVVPLGSTVRTINIMMFFLAGAVIFFAVIVALVLSLWITKPIGKINDAAKKLAARDYGVTFEGKGYREVAELADTLNFASKELGKVDLLQKELIANISHDLRTPLTLISGYAEVMRDLPDEKNEENLQIIIDESNRMKTLVNDVLDISKLDAGAGNMTFEPVSLTNCIESELTRYNKLRDREGYTIEFLYDERVTVKGDAVRLMQVVYNLVNNAVNYAGEDKKVTVRQQVKDGKVRISVIDHGEGIPEDMLPLIWERYYKVDKTHRRATVGSGLGLSIVKGIVKAHEGTYGVKSKVGVGSEFYFELAVTDISPLTAYAGEENTSDEND